MIYYLNNLYRLNRVFIPFFFSIILLGECFAAYGQKATGKESKITIEKNNLLRTIQAMEGDVQVSLPVTKNFELKLAELLTDIDRNRKLKTVERDKYKRSLAYFVQEINNYLVRKKIHLYQVEEAIFSYEQVLTALLQHKPILPVMWKLNALNSEIIGASFSQFKDHSLMNDVATYKRVSESPEFIFHFLEKNPDFRFADSLLRDVVTNDPMKIVYYLKNGDPRLQQRILNSRDSYLRQVASLYSEKHAGELIMFASQLSEGKMSQEEILSTRTEPAKYFELLVNTFLESKQKESSGLQFNLRKGIKDKALAFYVNEVNELHNSPDAVRFASIKNLRPQDLYFIITFCNDELYTSSYLGLYKRLMTSFKGPGVDSLFDLVKWENFHQFIRMAANYNVLGDFFQRLSPGKLKEVLVLFIGNIEMDPNSALERAMDIADSFGSLGSAPDILDFFQSEIGDNLARCKSKQSLLGVRLYGILHDMLGLSRQKDGLQELWKALGDYELLKRSVLEDAKGTVSELVLFYGDEDGVASFKNFMSTYDNNKKWQVSRNKHWVSIRTLAGHPLVIFANLPLNMQNRADLDAQDSLFVYLRANAIEPAILVHRGHSYHLDKTLKRLTPAVKLAILGSCGAYNKAISIASINPDVQIIGSKQTGTQAINDPIIEMVNVLLGNGNDLVWPEIWNKLDAQFRKNEAMRIIFSEYFPPSHNLGLFLLKLYRSNLLAVPR